MKYLGCIYIFVYGSNSHSLNGHIGFYVRSQLSPFLSHQLSKEGLKMACNYKPKGTRTQLMDNMLKAGDESAQIGQKSNHYRNLITLKTTLKGQSQSHQCLRRNQQASVTAQRSLGFSGQTAMLNQRKSWFLFLENQPRKET